MPEINLNKDKLMNTFVDQLIADKGWTDRGPEEVLRLQFKLKAQAEEAIDREILDALSDEQLVKLDEMTSQGTTDEELEEFFDGLEIDYVGVVQKALANLRKQALNDEVKE